MLLESIELWSLLINVNYENDIFRVNDIGEKGDCNHILTFWFNITQNNSNGCKINCKLYYLQNFITVNEVETILKKLKNNLDNK